MVRHWRLRALSSLLLLLYLLPPVCSQTYYTELTKVMVLGTDRSEAVENSCHCKIKCAAASDCLASTFDESDSTCHISTGPETSITTTDLASGTSWFKFEFTPASSSPPTIFLSTSSTQSSEVETLNTACANDGGIPADLINEEHKTVALDLVSALDSQYLFASKRWAWLIAKDSDSDGVFEWSDGTPVTTTVFTESDFTGSGAASMLRSDGKIELCDTSVSNGYPVVCITQ